MSQSYVWQALRQPECGINVKDSLTVHMASRTNRFLKSHKSARKICYDINDFISGPRTNTVGRLGCIDWIKFSAIDPLVFYNDYYGKIDANGDGKLQRGEIAECYRRVLEKCPKCPGQIWLFWHYKND